MKLLTYVWNYDLFTKFDQQDIWKYCALVGPGFIFEDTNMYLLFYFTLSKGSQLQ
jgi:hypothetical protein